MKRFVFVGVIIGIIVCVLLLQSATVQVAQPMIIGAASEADPIPYMEYQVYNNTIIEDSEPLPVFPNGMGDYTPLFDKYNLCDLVTSGEIDEIWIWAGSGDGVTLGNLLEWTTTGPGWSGLTPDCGEVVTTMVYNYTRKTDQALHSYGHRMEGLMRHNQPCELSTENWPWDAVNDIYGYYDNCDALLSDSYGFVARPFPGNNHIAGCGDVHYPPNITQEDGREYIYNEIATTSSICPDWSMDGSASVSELNCQIWGCTHYGYQVWWLQNFPGLDNTNRDRGGDYQPNWWTYLFDGEHADTPTPQPTPTTAPLNLIFLPNIISASQNQQISDNVHIATDPDGFQFSTTPTQPNSIITSETLTSAEAVVKPVAFVINLTAYEANGTPINDVATLNTQLIAGLKEATIYHGYMFNPYLSADFLGQDGASFAGAGCSAGSEPDNVHIYLTDLKTDIPVVSYRVDDIPGQGVWAMPCDPVSNWLLHVESSVPGTADLYFKPFRDAPDGTLYTITVNYEDGSIQSATVIGSHIAP